MYIRLQLLTQNMSYWSPCGLPMWGGKDNKQLNNKIPVSNCSPWPTREEPLNRSELRTAAGIAFQRDAKYLEHLLGNERACGRQQGEWRLQLCQVPDEAKLHPPEESYSDGRGWRNMAAWKFGGGKRNPQPHRDPHWDYRAEPGGIPPQIFQGAAGGSYDQAAEVCLGAAGWEEHEWASPRWTGETMSFIQWDQSKVWSWQPQIQAAGHPPEGWAGESSQVSERSGGADSTALSEEGERGCQASGGEGGKGGWERGGGGGGAAGEAGRGEACGETCR